MSIKHLVKIELQGNNFVESKLDLYYVETLYHRVTTWYVLDMVCLSFTQPDLVCIKVDLTIVASPSVRLPKPHIKSPF